MASPCLLHTYTVGGVNLPKIDGGTMGDVHLCAIDDIMPGTEVTAMFEDAATCPQFQETLMTATKRERARAIGAFADAVAKISRTHGFYAALHSVPYVVAVNALHCSTFLEPQADHAHRALAARLLSAILAKPDPVFSVTTIGLNSIKDGHAVTVHPMDAPGVRMICNIEGHHHDPRQRASIKPENLNVQYHQLPVPGGQAIACIQLQHGHIARAIEPRPKASFLKTRMHKSRAPASTPLPKTCAACHLRGTADKWSVCACGLVRYCNATCVNALHSTRRRAMLLASNVHSLTRLSTRLDRCQANHRKAHKHICRRFLKRIEREDKLVDELIDATQRIRTQQDMIHELNDKLKRAEDTRR